MQELIFFEQDGISTCCTLTPLDYGVDKVGCIAVRVLDECLETNGKPTFVSSSCFVSHKSPIIPSSIFAAVVWMTTIMFTILFVLGETMQCANPVALRETEMCNNKPE